MNEKVAILGCAKNCAKYLPSTMTNIHKIGSVFKDYHVFIYENDSSDGTNTLVRKYNNHPKVTGINQTSVNISYRTWCIAHGRNILLKALINSKFNPKYVIVMDMDDIGAKTNFKGLQFVEHAMNLKEHWDCIVPKLSYDKWAYRAPNVVRNYWKLNPAWRIKYLKYMDYKVKTLKYDSRGLTAIYSGFNGIAIYKYNLYIKGKYNGKSYVNSKYEGMGIIGLTNLEECEHVNFHKSLGPCRLMMCKDIQYP